jgi:hypothetical protein
MAAAGRSASRTSPYRIMGGNGEWFAWSTHDRFRIWQPNAARIEVFGRKGERRNVIAIMGRTPSEALYRLKRLAGEN